jgi:hypothetical protein
VGTRSLTVFEGEDGTEICVLYRQMDGYPTVHGAALKEFLDGFHIQNGYSFPKPQRAANGMGCLAAQAVAYFKEGIGDFYLYPAGTRDCGEEYIYTVYHDGELRLRLQAGCVTLFGLPGTKQGNMPTLYDGTIADFDPEEIQNAWRSRTEDPPNDFLESL